MPSDVLGFDSLAAGNEHFLTERLIAIGFLTSCIVHELNNPLACIASNLDFLETEFEQKNQDEYVLALKDSQEAMGGIRSILQNIRVLAEPDAVGDNEFHVANTQECLDTALLLTKSLLQPHRRVEPARRSGQSPRPGGSG